MNHCSACQHENPATARFCNQCGQTLSVSASAPAAVPATRSYTPRHLADRILQNAHALKGERKRVTVVFADVKGSTGLAQRAGAERWHQILDQLFSLLAGAVHRFEGSVNQYTGDGIMALFGAPIAHEDHAIRAAHAALEIREKVRAFADELRLQDGLNLSVRVGMNSGEVIVGAIGDDLRMDYTAQGHTVNLAARMEAIAEPGRIYLTQDSAQLLNGYFRMRDLGAMTVQGVAEPTRVYELEALGDIVSRLELSRSRGLSRFVGREPEITQLGELLAEVQAQGRGRVVSVSGNAGIGKSRLCDEFVQTCRARGLAVHTASAVPYADAMPYYPVQQLLRAYFGIARDDDADSARRKIAGALLLRDDSARDALTFVFDFLGLGTHRADADAPAPALRMQRLKALCSDAMLEKTGASIILLEDVHWADAGSVEFFQHLFTCAQTAPVLILCNHRSDYVLDWLWPQCDDELALEALDETATDGLLAQLLGESDNVAELRALISARAGGNPYFVEEAVRSLIESGQLQGSIGHYELLGSLAEVRIPESVQAILAARIDRLPSAEKNVLYAAAVLGKNFSETTLLAMLHASQADRAAGNEANAATHLQALVESGFVYAQDAVAQNYVFCHPLMQEVAYTSQLGQARKDWHRQAAQVLEASFTMPLAADEGAVLLAHHWRHAEAYQRAAEWDLRAAAWLVQRDVAATLARFRAAIAALDNLDEQTQRQANVRKLAVSARAGLVRSASIIQVPAAEVERAYREARAMVEAQAGQPGLAELLLSHAIHVLNLGRAHEATALVEEALAIIAANGEPETLARFRIPVLNVYLTSGGLARGLEVIEQYGDWASANIDVENFASRGLRAIMIGYMGRLPEARAELAATLRVSEANNRRASWISSNMVELDYLCGEGSDSFHHAEAARLVAQEFGSPLFAWMAQFALAIANFLAQKYDLAAEILAHGRDSVAPGAPAHQFESQHLALMAEVALHLKDVEHAHALAQAALNSACQAGARLWEIIARLALARTLLARKASSDEVSEQLNRIEALIAATGAITLNGFMHSISAQHRAAQGDDEAATQYWARARQAFADSGAHARAAAINDVLDHATPM